MCKNVYFNCLYFNIAILDKFKYIPLKGEIIIEQLKKLEILIEELRAQLYDIINKKDGDLLSPEVVTASKMLDSALNTYIELIK